MAVSVVEVVATTVTTGTTSPYNATFSFTNTPQAGDRILVVASVLSSQSVVSMSGAGGTWTLLTSQRLIGSTGNAYYVGTGATSAGPITVQGNAASMQFQITALLVRGINDKAAPFATSYATAGVSPNTEKVLAPGWLFQPGTIALVVAQQQGGTVPISAPTFPGPSSSAGWTVTYPIQQPDATKTAAIGTAYRIIGSANETPAISIVSGNNNYYVDAQMVFFGGPDGAAVETQYVEALTTGNPAAVIESAYTEALTVGNPAAVVESSYVEVLSKVDETNLVKVVEVGIADITASGTLSRTPSLATTPLAGDVVVLAYQLRGEGGSNPLPTGLTASGLGASWAQAYYVTGGSEFASAVWIGTGATASGTITASWTNSSRAGSVRAFLVRNLTSTTVTAGSVSAGVGGGTTQGPTLNATYGNFVLDLLSQAFGNTSVSEIPSAYLPASRWITQPNSESLGRYASTYRIPELNSIESHRVDKNLDSGFTEIVGGLLFQAVIGPPPPVNGLLTFTVDTRQSSLTSKVTTPSTVSQVSDKLFWFSAKDIPGANGDAVLDWPNRDRGRAVTRVLSSSNARLTLSTAGTPLGTKSVVGNGSADSFTLQLPFDKSALKLVTANVEGVGEEGWRCADGDPNTGWYANGNPSVTPAWVQYALLSGKVITSYGIRSRGGWTNRAPKNWTFQGSNDGSTWTTLDTQTNITGWTGGDLRMYSLSNSTTYSYYRLYVTGSQDNSSVNIEELVLVGVGGEFTIPQIDSTSAEMWVVCKTGSTNSTGYPARLAATNDVNHYGYGGTNYTSFASTYRPGFGFTGYDPTQWHILRLKQDGSVLSVWGKGVSQGTANVSFGRTDLARIFAGGSSGDWPFQGEVAEVIALGRTATSQEVTLIENYLTNEHLVASSPQATGMAGFTIGASVTAGQVVSYSSVVLADSPMGYWKLNESSGAVFADSSGNGRNATSGYIGTIIYGQSPAGAISGTSLHFQGDPSASPNVPAASWPSQNYLTVEAWIKPIGGAAGQNMHILDRENQSSGSGRCWQFGTQGKGLTGIVFTGPSTYQTVSVPSVIEYDVWTHVALTFDGTTVRLYVNGSQVGSGALSGVLNAGGTQPLTLAGSGPSGTAQPFNGWLDEMAVYSTALSATTITNHYNVGATGTGTPPSSPVSTTTGSLPFTVGATGNVWFIGTGQLGLTTGLTCSTVSSVATPTGTLPATASITGQAYGISDSTAALTASASSTEYGITTGLTVGFTASLTTSTLFKIIPTTGTVPLTSTLTASPQGITSAMEALTISSTGTPVGVATGLLGLNLDFSMRDAGVVIVGLPTTVGMTTLAAGTAFTSIATTIGAPVQVAGATDSAVGFSLSIFDSTLDCTKFRWVYTDSEGWLTSTITVRLVSETISIGWLQSSTGFYAKVNSALGANGSLVSTITGQQISLAVNYEGFGTLQTHLASFLKDVTVWFAGPVAESLYTTGPAAGVGTGHGPYLENEYWISGPED